MMWAILAKISGSWSRTQRSLVSVKLGSAGLAVSSMSFLRPTSPPPNWLVSHSHCGSVRTSHQMSDGAEDFAIFVEHDGAVHLAGEADGVDGRGFTRAASDLADGLLRGAPPVFGVLLGPAGVRDAKRLMLGRGFGNDVPFFIHQNGARAACAHIHTQKHGVSSFVRVQNKCSKERGEG